MPVYKRKRWLWEPVLPHQLFPAHGLKPGPTPHCAARFVIPWRSQHSPPPTPSAFLQREKTAVLPVCSVPAAPPFVPSSAASGASRQSQHAGRGRPARSTDSGCVVLLLKGTSGSSLGACLCWGECWGELDSGKGTASFVVVALAVPLLPVKSNLSSQQNRSDRLSNVVCAPAARAGGGFLCLFVLVQHVRLS